MDRELVQSDYSACNIITIDILTKLGKHFGVEMYSTREEFYRVARRLENLWYLMIEHLNIAGKQED